MYWPFTDSVSNLSLEGSVFISTFPLIFHPSPYHLFSEPFIRSKRVYSTSFNKKFSFDLGL